MSRLAPRFPVRVSPFGVKSVEMLATGERPRELRWYHAGPMLFGDWGTSRLYVLGLAFAFTGRSSFWFVAAMCGLMIGVGWSYEIICRLFPDGGGVYSSARHRSQLLAVVGGLLLCADYVVTASLSCLDAFHYLGLKDFKILGIPVDALAAALTILAIGGLNYFGPTKTGSIAMVIALATVILTMVIGLACLPHLGVAFERVESPFRHGVWSSWIGFTEIVLALSGVEAIANMTGIMVQPVEKTAKKAILPVLIEIVILNLILALAMTSLPDSILGAKNPDGQLAHTGDMLKQIAIHYVGHGFAAIASVVFAALLLSAVNTALADLVSIQFMLSRDKELPKNLSKLNRFGMPMLPLVIGSIIPAVVVLIFSDVEKLAALYAIGVVGAISINLGTTSTNPELPLAKWERIFMIGLTLIMLAIGFTICTEKPAARSFALIVLVAGLAGRLITIVSSKVVPIERGTRYGYTALAIASVVAELGIAVFMGDDWKAFIPSAAVALIIGYASYETQKYRAYLLGQVKPTGQPAEPGVYDHDLDAAAPAKPKMILKGEYTPKERIMVATTGNPRLIDFAMKECKNRQAELDILFIRHLAVTPMGPTAPPSLAEDSAALELFERLRIQAHDAGVPLRLLYGVARDIPEAILDMAVTHGADLLLLGTTRRGTLWKAMKGDVIQAVAEQLPERIGLLIHA
jgi:amino acid transporter/nucleotide-binding universal stress UspA family protein